MLPPMTPYRVSLCVLLGLATRQVDLALSFDEPRGWRLRLLVFLLAQTQGAADCEEPSFLQLVDLLLLALGQDLGDALAQNLAVLVNFETEDVLLELMLTGMFQLTAPNQDLIEPEVSALHPDTSTHLAASSPLGVFVRQCVVAFAGQSFGATCALHAQCVAYVHGHRGPFTHRLGATPPDGGGDDMCDHGELKPYADALFTGAPRPGDDLLRLLHYRSGGASSSSSPPHNGIASSSSSIEAAAAAAAAPPGGGGGVMRHAQELDKPCGRVCAAVVRVGGAPAGARAFARHLHACAPSSAPDVGVGVAIALATHDVAAAVEGLHAQSEVGPPGWGVVDTLCAGPGGLVPPSDAGAFPPRAPGFGAAAGAAIRGQLSLAAFHIGEGHLETGLALLDATVRVAHTANDAPALAHSLGLVCQLLMRCDPTLVTSSSSRWPGNFTPAGDGRDMMPRHVARLRVLLQHCFAKALEANLPALATWAAEAHAYVVVRTGEVDAPRVASVAAMVCAHIAHEAAIAVQCTPPGGANAAKPAPPPGGIAGSAPVPGAPAHLFASLPAAASHMATGLGGATGAGRLGDPGRSGGFGGGGAGLLTGSASVTSLPAPLPQHAGAPAPGQVAAAARAAARSRLVAAAAWRAVGARDMMAAQVACFLAAHGPGSEGMSGGGECAVTLGDVAFAYAMHVSARLDAAGPSAAVDAIADALQHVGARAPYVHNGVALCVPGPLREAACTLHHAAAVRAGALRDAQHACACMAALASPRRGVDPEFGMKARLMQAATALACGHCHEASTQAAEVASRCRALGLGTLTLAAVLLQCDAHAAAGDLLTALPLAAQAAAQAHALGCTSAAAEAVTMTCELHARRGAPRGTARTWASDLRDALPFIRGHGPLSLRGRAHMALARARLVECTVRDGDGGGEQLTASVARDACAHCQEAAQAWTEAGDVAHAAEAMHLAACVHHAAGDTVARDQAATRALALAAAAQQQQRSGQLCLGPHGDKVRDVALGVGDWPIALRLAIGRAKP